MSKQAENKRASYREPLILIAFVILGAILGLTLGERASFLYPIGQIWLNLLFVLLVPLIFFPFPAPSRTSRTPGGSASCWRSPLGSSS